MSRLSSSVRHDPEGIRLIGSIDAGTSSTRFTVYNQEGEIVATAQTRVKSIFPDDGWCEHDPEEILRSTYECMRSVAIKMQSRGFLIQDVKAIGLTNQRETIVVWDKVTGRPLRNTIAGLDTRTMETVQELVEKANGNQLYLQKTCGLPISTYFSAVKLRWILDHDASVREEALAGRCLCGTVDSWLIWNFTGGVKGGIHVTDVTNASRTMLMNLQTQKWDPELLRFFNIDQNMLPEIRSCSEIYGQMSSGPFEGTFLAGIVGDEQAALVGQNCFRRGDAKNTYGTGCFLLYNTGTRPVISKNGLLTTVAYKLGPKNPCHFALEGSIAIAGEAVRWLRDNMGIIKKSEEVGTLAKSVTSTHGVYFVPAFSGLLAPYWRPDARGVIVGLTQYSTKAHIARATLEAVCFQTREVLEACNKDCGIPVGSLRVDGGMAANDVLLGLQADLLGLDVERPDNVETTSWGAALMAGMADGIDIWKLEDLPTHSKSRLFTPSNSVDDRDERYAYWRRAVVRSYGWINSDGTINGKPNNEKPELRGMGRASAVVLCALAAVVGLWVFHRRYEIIKR